MSFPHYDNTLNAKQTAQHHILLHTSTAVGWLHLGIILMNTLKFLTFLHDRHTPTTSSLMTHM